MRYHRLERLINLHEGYSRAFRIDGLELLLVEVDGQRMAFERRCPHRGQVLRADDIVQGQIRCPLHGYCFDLFSGAVLHASEERCRALKTFDLVYQGNEVGIML